jgi:hypothetical protein
MLLKEGRSRWFNGLTRRVTQDCGHSCLCECRGEEAAEDGRRIDSVESLTLAH